MSNPLKPIGKRKDGVPTREEMYKILKARSIYLQSIASMQEKQHDD